MNREKLPVFRWHKHNRFRLLRNGDQFFPAMLDAIGHARRNILLELYLFESGSIADRFISALADAARREVTVRVMIDAFGSLALADEDRKALRSAGVQLHVFNPLKVLGDRLRNLARDHRKLLVVDDEVAFVGGAGITDEFDPDARPDRYWRETMLEIRGEVVHDWSRLFANVWAHAGNAPFRVTGTSHAHDAEHADLRQMGRVAIAHGPAVQDVKRHVLAQLDSAKRRAWIATPYFLPSIPLRRALIRAARRGVDVRLVLPGSRTDHPLLWVASHHYYGRLLANNIRILEYQPRFIHSKTVLVDDWVSLGSCNFDRWNLHWNLEANQEVLDEEFASIVGTMFEDDMQQSIEIDAEAWARRLPLVRSVEDGLADFGTRVERWLNRR